MNKEVAEIFGCVSIVGGGMLALMSTIWITITMGWVGVLPAIGVFLVFGGVAILSSEIR